MGRHPPGRQAANTQELLQVIWCLRAAPIARQRTLTVIIVEHGPLRPARLASAQQQAMEGMPMTLEPHPNRHRH